MVRVSHPVAVRALRAGLFLFATLSFVTAPAGAYTPPTLKVVPNNHTNTNGNSTATYPFSQTSMHYQQVFDHSQLPAGGGTITEIAFRAQGTLAKGAGGTPFWPSSPMTKVIVKLGSTSKAVGGLSTTFASNF